MPSILVVDDAPIDRHMVEGILKTEEDYAVTCVESGEQALSRMTLEEPDLVVTDLQMPEMSGLELVTQIQLYYPEIPVVLTTAHGSEDLAVEALRAGAASYVPKPQLAECLLDTVGEVLASVVEDETRRRLSQCVDSASFAFTVDSDLELIGSLVGLLQDIAGTYAHFPAGTLHRFSFGLASALTYVMCRGNLGWGLEEFESLHTGREETIQKAIKQSDETPFQGRKLRVKTNFSRDEVEVIIEHDGDPLGDELLTFDPQGELGRTNARGLVLMRSFFSALEITNNGMQVKLGAQVSAAEEG